MKVEVLPLHFLHVPNCRDLLCQELMSEAKLAAVHCCMQELTSLVNYSSSRSSAVNYNAMKWSLHYILLTNYNSLFHINFQSLS